MNNTKIKKIALYMITFLLLTYFPYVTFAFLTAKDYTPLEPNAFKGFDTAGTSQSSLANFLGNVFNFGVAAATVLALIMIVWGGIEYMTTDSWSGKDSGKGKIKDALYGLGLALASYMILYTINPCLVIFTNKDGCNANTFLFSTSASNSTTNTSGSCSNCVSASEKGLNCKTSPCNMNIKLAEALQGVLGVNGARITEAYPPTVSHKDSCHSDGTCVDVNFLNQSERVEDVKRLYDALVNSGLKPVYESDSCSRYEAVGVTCGIYDTTTRDSNNKVISSFHVEI